jgi:DNA-binding Lrp family transcriptional regulator
MIKEKDFDIIKELRKNSRMHLKEIGKRIDMPLASVFERMKKIKNLIIKNTTILNYNQLFFPITIVFGLRINEYLKEDLYYFLKNSNNVNNFYRTSGVYNVLVEAIFVNLKQANDFSDKLKKFMPMKISEHQLIEEIKKEEFYT